MNKKNIQIIIVIGCFAAMAFVIYNNFFKSSAPSVAVGSPALGSVAETPQTILPYGQSLDFSVLTSRPFQYSQVQYTQVNPNGVGIAPQNLIQPLLPTAP